MKKRIAKFFLAGMTTAALSFSALAADVSGLSAFLDIHSYTETVFSDVDAENWYASGVKMVYEKGIMDGVGMGKFAPSAAVTWTQAVTIAARLHATYNGIEIPESEGNWYDGYLAYAERAGILPSTTPKTSLTDRLISRQELAGLFNKVFTESELPVMNDMEIPDLPEVLPEFQSAVQNMYSAGIFTGKDGGKFDPNGTATRAEIAVVVSRLLSPGQRQSFDSAADQNMANQWGNYKSGGYVAQNGDVTYYTVRERTASESWRYSIVARENSGETNIVYETANALTRLAAAEDGLLYFVEGQTVLRSLDPATGEEKSLYTSPVQLKHFVLYGDEVYIFECYAQTGATSEWRYRIGRVEKNGLTILVNNMEHGKISELDVLHAFQGKLYYVYGKDTAEGISLWSVDLETKKNLREFAGIISEGKICFDGSTYWYFRERNNNVHEIVRGNILMKTYEEVLAVLPEAAAAPYHHMYANGGTFFFQSSGAACIWKIDPSGLVHEVAKMTGSYYEKSSVTEQGIIIHALESLSALMPQQIFVQLPDGSCENYLRFLNRPYWENGTALYETDGREIVWDDVTITEGEVTVEAERAYYTTSGDMVMELSICNGLAAEISPVMITLTLSDGERQIEAVFYWLDNVAADHEQMVSVVIPAEKLGEALSLKNVEKSITLKYNKKG